MARVSKAQAAEHRAAIVRAASALFRARGLAGVGVAEITRAAGLTHGGFYGHFASKDVLAAEAIAAAFEDGKRRLVDDGLAGYLRGYLSRRHRDRPEEGCPLLALAGSHEPRGREIDAALARGAAMLLEETARRLPDRAGEPVEARRRRACGLLATAIGGQVLARSLAGEAIELSDVVLAAAREEIRARLESGAEETAKAGATKLPKG